MSAPRRVTVLGAGSWGTTFAQLVADADPSARVVVWGRDAAVTEEISRAHANSRYLKGLRLPAGVSGTTDLAAALGDVDDVVLAVPVQRLRGVLATAASHLAPRPGGSSTGPTVISLLKGLELETHLRVSQVVREVLGDLPFAVVSGPNLAREIAERRPCATVAAAEQEDIADRAAALCATDYFRPFTARDVIGVEVAGAAKNLLAVGVGLAEGLGLGDNAKASVIALGLAEVTRLVVAMGGSAATVAGLAGAGDAFATCASTLSRNHRLGVGLSQGRPLQEVLDGLGGTAEAVGTARSITALAEGAGVAMGVIEQVAAVLVEGRDPRDAALHLLSQPLRDERLPWR
ncbi:glycerol 3-phosphate dehydrogenase (NAD(P)+) [Quadrisphaera granulorum]|uniref:Glycerol-3-phosphate dehydrogenase [NAD(P)+] n=1 Tax=Quadrisphaera granulorum TaxID=317664 RepID=A0A316B1E4_9ACTN|nr:NAD(P)H-dependent glycerol-3-phosphate dehydrogenase [Quadrisphaera granulorum]PWJ56357.1 glycerol 3-phosphate dehydrogenase (NAD(P)+) [Quadrisphaera granulorum]SZE94991.1 glycerol 3-phosphate dehydrogenase (NAD(P)+) [Quadrisphaera granulorum]